MDGDEDYQSWWMASTEAPTYPVLPVGGAEAEVVVLGGGIAGLTTAYSLAREGRKVAVVEADRIAAGVSGFTTAKVTVGHNLIYADLADRFDASTAEAYARSQAEAMSWLCDTVEREEIDCELERRPAVVYTESPDEAEKIRAEVSAARAAGLEVREVAETDLPYDVIAAIEYPDQAQFHPRKYLLALAEAIVALGGRVFEQTRALDVEDGSPCVVETDRGQVRGKDVVVATHYPFLDRGLLFARLAPYRDVVVAFAVSAASAPSVMAISTGAEDGGTHSVRSAPYLDGQRLLIVTGGQYKTGSTTAVIDRYEELAAWARSRFDVGEVVHRWSTQDAASVDRLPFVGQLPRSGDHVWVATGFSAWGMTGGTMAGMLLADLLQQRRNPWARVYDPSRKDVRAAATKLVSASLGVAKELLTGQFRVDIGGVEELEAGQAGILSGRGSRIAAYRDQDGVVHAVSARCTHMGCTVRFNDAERSWDCPCHGSRFDIDGHVLAGPAVDPLEARGL